jgi:hypothetical protein
VWLSEKFVSYNTEEALLISLFHDINRLPFAHNLEKVIHFDQANNLRLFLNANHYNIPDETLASFSSMLNKQVDGSLSSRLAFAADSISGFLEDTLFAITTLNLSPGLIPNEVLRILCLDFNNPNVNDHVKELKRLFQSNPYQFIPLFNSFVLELSKQFSEVHNSEYQLFIELEEFHYLRKVIKQDLLVEHIFPINNIRVSQGPRLANEVSIPYMKLLKDDGLDPIMELLKMTDQQLLDAAYNRGVIKELNTYYPIFPQF